MSAGASHERPDAGVPHRVPALGGESREGAMTSRRKFLLSLFFAVILFGHAWDIASYEDHWPFAAYKMYAFVSGNKFSFMILYGVDEHGSEFPINTDAALYPFYRRQFNVELESILGATLSNRGHFTHSNPAVEKYGKAAIVMALSDVVGRYNRRVRAGELKGPSAVAARVYEVGWTLDPWARNRDTPDSRQLRFELDSLGLASP
jgi:hypothetical protein